MCGANRPARVQNTGKTFVVGPGYMVGVHRRLLDAVRTSVMAQHASGGLIASVIPDARQWANTEAVVRTETENATKATI